MTWSLSSLWRWGAYGFYAIVIFGVCVYITFPTPQFHAWLLAEADRRYGVRLAAQALHAHTPLRLDIEGVTLSIDPARIPSSRTPMGSIYALPIEHLRLEVHVWPLLLGQGVLSTEISVFGGVIAGTFIAERDDGQWRYHANGNIESMHLQPLEERMFVSREAGQVFTGGSAAMTLDLAWTGENIRAAIGTVSVRMDDMIVNLAGLSPVTLSELSGSLTLDQRGWWRTDDLRVVSENNGLTATGQGRFLFDGPFSGSTVNLSMSVTMDETAKRQYPQLGVFMPGTGEPALLTVTGTISRPVILLNGVPILAR